MLLETMFTAKYASISLISIPYRGKFCREKLANFLYVLNIFPDENFYIFFFRKPQVERKITSNSLYKMGKSGKLQAEKNFNWGESDDIVLQIS